MPEEGMTGLIPPGVRVIGSLAPAVSERGEAREGPVVMFPADPDELVRLSSGTAGRPAVAVSDFIPRFPLPGVSVFIRAADPGLQALSALFQSYAQLEREDSAVRLVLWQSSGALLPFFVHNMNNLLARIMGNAELARLYIDRPDTAGEKLASAMAGAEELRDFVQKLARMSMVLDDDSGWTAERLEGLERTGRMFSGRAVDFTFERGEGTPERISMHAGRLDLAVTLAAASAAMKVNGCGRLAMSASGDGGYIRFSIDWESKPGQAGLLSGTWESSLELLSTAAAWCAFCGFSLMIHRWNRREGKVSLLAGSQQEREGPHE